MFSCAMQQLDTALSYCIQNTCMQCSHKKSLCSGGREEEFFFASPTKVYSVNICVYAETGMCNVCITCSLSFNKMFKCSLSKISAKLLFTLYD